MEYSLIFALKTQMAATCRPCRCDATYVNRLDGDCLNPATLDLALELARKAVQLDPNLPEAHAILGFELTFRLHHDASMASVEKALALNPNYTDWRLGYPTSCIVGLRLSAGPNSKSGFGFLTNF
jgi:tetratricopeptide (TPR) repeat protein